MTTRISAATTVGELVAERPARSRVFEALRIDYCCGGKLPLSDACAKRGLDAKTVVGLLEEADLKSENNGAANVTAMSLAELADHVVTRHHEYLREELPRLDVITEKVFRVHGDREPRLKEVREAFVSLSEEMLSHMAKEEHVLFPMIRKMEQTGKPQSCCGGTLAKPIEQMEAEHAESGDALETMRRATDGYMPPAWACNTYRAMLDGLAQLERDMHQHVHKENNVLFPRALALEAQLVGTGGGNGACEAGVKESAGGARGCC